MEQIENLDHHKTLRFYFFSKKWRLRRNLLRVKEKFKPRVSFVKKVLRDDEIFIGAGVAVAIFCTRKKYLPPYFFRQKTPSPFIYFFSFFVGKVLPHLFFG